MSTGPATLSEFGLRRGLTVLCVTEIVSWGVLYYAFPVLAPTIAADTGWSIATTTAAFSTVAMVALLDRTVRALHRNLSTETDESLARTMHFPTAWDPDFKPTMSVLDVYHFGTQHFDHHRRQLTLRSPGGG